MAESERDPYPPLPIDHSEEQLRRYLELTELVDLAAIARSVQRDEGPTLTHAAVPLGLTIRTSKS